MTACDPGPSDAGETVTSPVTGTVLAVLRQPGEEVVAGERLLVVESMKMEYPVEAPVRGTVDAVAVVVGQSVARGEPLATLLPAVEEAPVETSERATGAVPAPGRERPEGERPGGERPELVRLRERRALLVDSARPDEVGRHQSIGHRSARQNVADLVDEGSFEEYGGFAVAAQRARRSEDELRRRTPADGLIAGIGRVNGDRFPDAAACAVLAYDYTVLAGTQGQINHRKKDRLLQVVARTGIPVVLFAEGGGGRPGDTDTTTITGLDTMAFALFGRLSGQVPLVGIAAGRCFAGNAALLGCCDVIIATADATIGMGGPAMIEGGGLGIVAPEEVGPLPVQVASGVVDVAAADEAEAVAAAKRYLGYFQGSVVDWSCADQAALRTVLPERRVEVHDVRAVVALVADEGSVLELRPAFAPGMVTALARVEGRPVGILANNPVHLAGAIDGPGAAKAARLMSLCDAFGIPLVSLVDTPGFLVGPEAEAAGLVRQAARMFTVGASVTVPWCAVVVRKAYGLGAQAMAGGSLHAPLRTVAWPGGELGGMGLEGAVRLGFRRELDAAGGPEERRSLFDKLVTLAYERGQALEVASVFEIDDVIDPADTRAVVLHTLSAAGAWERPARPSGWPGGRRPSIDAW